LFRVLTTLWSLRFLSNFASLLLLSREGKHKVGQIAGEMRQVKTVNQRDRLTRDWFLVSAACAGWLLQRSGTINAASC
jgi:hypothetical protein